MREVSLTTPLSVFLEQFQWYCEAVDLTLDELVGHLSERIQNPEQWSKIVKYALLIDDPIQIMAEVALCSLVASVPQRSLMKRLWSDKPGREVNWGETQLAVMTGNSLLFCSIERRKVPDTQLLGALSCIALRWLRVLEVVPVTDDKMDRIARLDCAIKSLPNIQVSWSLAISKRLKLIDKNVSASIDAGIKHWSGEGRRGKLLAEKFGEWLLNYSNRLKALNNDTLFEWTAVLYIARAAQAIGWTLNSGSPLKQGKYSTIYLMRDGLILRVSKGKPRDGADKYIGVDLVAKIAAAAGLEPSGYQPDIVLTFYMKNELDKVVTFLADAKRNEKGEGKKYIKPSIEKAVAYVYAHNNILSISPRCTLFFWQGVTKILGVAVASDDIDCHAEKILEKLGGGDHPEILCFDRRMMNNPDILGAWVNKLAEMSRQELDKKLEQI